MDNELGKTLKALRSKNGLTQKQLADMVYVEASAISKIECGRSGLSTELATNLARALDTSTDVILGTGLAVKEIPYDKLQHVISQVTKAQASLEELRQDLESLKEKKRNEEEKT